VKGMVVAKYVVVPHCLISENHNSSVYMNKVLVHGKHETEWVTISKDEYDSMNRTIEVLTDRDIMEQIKKSKEKNVKSRDFEEVAKELGI
jgi:PHD/YefM family antitoxin component YafN of YafNO toxin-antitoxin module